MLPVEAIKGNTVTSVRVFLGVGVRGTPGRELLARSRAERVV